MCSKVITNVLQFGEYKILLDRSIGQGGFATVFECDMIGNNDGRQYCAKIQQLHNFDAFNREGDILFQLSQLSNVNIIQIKCFGVYVVNGKRQMIVIMEKCSHTLKEELKQREKFTEEEIYDFLNQFSNGYKVLFDRKIVHRDLKPENILVAKENGRTIFKIADFGTCKFCINDDSNCTELGTPSYTQSGYVFICKLMTGQLPFPEEKKGLKEFYNKLKEQTYCQNQEMSNTQLSHLIRKMITYQPAERIEFKGLCDELSHKVENLNDFNLPQNSGKVKDDIQQIPLDRVMFVQRPNNNCPNNNNPVNNAPNIFIPKNNNDNNPSINNQPNNTVPAKNALIHNVPFNSAPICNASNNNAPNNNGPPKFVDNFQNNCDQKVRENNFQQIREHIFQKKVNDCKIPNQNNQPNGIIKINTKNCNFIQYRSPQPKDQEQEKNKAFPPFFKFPGKDLKK